jgi:hypothetical protein
MPAPDPAPPAPAYMPFKAATDAYVHMKAIYKGLSAEEQTKLVSKMENSGF